MINIIDLIDGACIIDISSDKYFIIISDVFDYDIFQLVPYIV